VQKPGTKVFVGLSGGVDSAVSATLLKEAGYNVTGVFIRIALPGYPCPAAQDRIDAMRVAAHLKIPFKEVDLSAEYEAQVFKPSIQEFARGRTPNPDTLCNEKIKFGIFFDYCMQQGADFVATGHYAQTTEGELFVSADPNKDQTYFLWAVPETALRKTLFPVGALHKSEVRRLAEKFGLPNFDRPDSQGLCFLGPIELDDMLEREVPQTPGKVLNERGDVVGTHRGSVHYTVGQRHGFELVTTSTTEVPHFVIGKNSKANTITVSPSKFPIDKKSVRVVLADANWIGEMAPGPCEARFRYRQKLISAELVQTGTGWVAVLNEPHYVPEGQSLVLYRGERCLGGGVISGATLE
jgi:tRNA-specific 2-thiouridylase